MGRFRSTWLLSLALFAILAVTLFLGLNTQSLFAAGNTIILSGRVTSQADGSGVQGIVIRLYDAGFPGFIDVASTDSAGYYTVTEASQLSPGNFFLQFLSNGTFVSEFYSDTTVYESATPLHLSVDEPKVVNAVLVEGGEVRGKISVQESDATTSSTGLNFYDAAGHEVISYFNTDASGVYTATGVPPGSYKIRAVPSGSDSFHTSIYYPDGITFAQGATVEISAGAVLTDINFELILGGQITGTFTSDTRVAFVDPGIEIYGEDGTLFTEWRAFPFIVQAPNYVARNLPPGNYRLLFSDLTGEHRPEYYDNKQSLDAATVVSVTAGSTTRINPMLTHIPRVTDIATSRGLTGTILLALQFNPVPIYTLDNGDSWRAVATAPWVTTDTVSSPAVAITPRQQSGEARRFIVSSSQISKYNDQSHTGVYRTGDDGQSWARSAFSFTLPFGSCNHILYSDVVASPIDPSELYLGLTCVIPTFEGSTYWSKVYASTNAGITWEQGGDLSSAPAAIGQLLTSPIVTKSLYVEGFGIWKQSDDSGQSWSQQTITSTLLALDAQDKQWLYGFDLYTGPSSNEYAGKHSENGGESWQNWQQQPCTSGPVQLMAHPTKTHVLFVRCDQGLFRSNDSGDHWKQLADTPGQLLAPDYSAPGRILWGKSDLPGVIAGAEEGLGLFASTNDGDSWQSIMAGYTFITPVPLFMPAIKENK